MVSCGICALDNLPFPIPHLLGHDTPPSASPSAVQWSQGSLCPFCPPSALPCLFPAPLQPEELELPASACPARAQLSCVSPASTASPASRAASKPVRLPQQILTVHPFPLGSVPLKASQGTGLEHLLLLQGPGQLLYHKCTWVMFSANGLASSTTDPC